MSRRVASACSLGWRASIEQRRWQSVASSAKRSVCSRELGASLPARSTEKATDEELNKFFNENFYMIYGVFLDTFSAYEANCKKGTFAICRLRAGVRARFAGSEYRSLQRVRECAYQQQRHSHSPTRAHTGKHSSSEIQDILAILKNVLIHLAELIRRKWQTRSIGTPKKIRSLNRLVVRSQC